MSHRVLRFARLIFLLLASAIAGAALTSAIAARQTPAAPPRVDIVLHRFDLVPGKEAEFQSWIAFLHANHRAAVATLGREKMYFEAMFTAPDEPGRLYWITAQGEDAAPVDRSTLPIDVKHRAYMADVLKKGSHARLISRNVLAPDFIVDAISQHETAPSAVFSTLTTQHHHERDMRSGARAGARRGAALIHAKSGRLG